MACRCSERILRHSSNLACVTRAYDSQLKRQRRVEGVFLRLEQRGERQVAAPHDQVQDERLVSEAYVERQLLLVGLEEEDLGQGQASGFDERERGEYLGQGALPCRWP